jgi:integrase
MTTHISIENKSNDSLKIHAFYKDMNLKESLKRRTKNAIFSFIKANPDLKLDTYFTDFRLLHGKKLIIKQDQTTTALKNLITYLENKNLSGNTITNYVSSIKQLHDYHHMELPHTAWKQIKNIQTHTGNSFYTTSPTKEQIQRILSNATALEKAYYLTIVTTGKRPEEILKIELTHLHLDEKPPRISTTVRNNSTKRRTPYAFITEECKEAIQTYLTQRPKFINRIISSNLPIENKERFKQSTKLYPISDRTIRKHWNILLDKSDLNEFSTNGNAKRHKFNQYSLKYYFRTYLGNPDLAEHLMGHTDISNLYCNKQEHEIAQDYLKYSKNLYIYGNQNTDDKIKQELKEKDEQIQRLITSDEMRKQQLFDMEHKLNALMKTLQLTEINNELYQYDDQTKTYEPQCSDPSLTALDKNKQPIKRKLLARRIQYPTSKIKNKG